MRRGPWWGVLEGKGSAAAVGVAAVVEFGTGREDGEEENKWMITCLTPRVFLGGSRRYWKVCLVDCKGEN